jgi:hypothetical protein
MAARELVIRRRANSMACPNGFLWKSAATALLHVTRYNVHGIPGSLAPAAAAGPALRPSFLLPGGVSALIKAPQSRLPDAVILG